MKRSSLIKRFYGLLKETNRTQFKETIVAAYSASQSTSVKDLTDKELQNAVDFLSQGSSNTPTLQDESKNKMRRKIIAICADTFQMVENGRADMNKIYKFVLEKGYLKKPFNEYEYNELPTLVSQFEKMQDWKSSQNSKQLKKSDD